MSSGRKAISVGVCIALAVTGCSGQGPSGNPHATTTGLALPGVPTEGRRPSSTGLPAAAEPQSAPAQLTPTPGQAVPVGQSPEGVAVDSTTRTVAVATRRPDRLVMVDADTAAVRSSTALPGSARHVELAAPGGPMLVPVETANAVVLVSVPMGSADRPIVTGTAPHDAAAAANGTIFVSNELGGTVAAVRHHDVVKLFGDSVQPAGMAAVGNTVAMLDARANTLTTYDAEALHSLGIAPAGVGPTHLIADRHGRVIAADTRGNVVRVFVLGPAPTQVGLVAQAGGPYGIAYDTVRDRLWVASSGANEVVGYDMTESNPREIKRLSTVQNPYSLGVDSATGRLFIAGVSTGVLQIVDTA